MGWNFKEIMLHLKSASSNLVTCKVSSKNKKPLNLGAKIPYLGISALQSNKKVSNFQSAPSNLWNYKLSSKTKKTKQKNLGLKKLYLGLLAGMLENYCHIYNHHAPICLIAKFRATIRILKLGTKNALFGCFGQLLRESIVIFATSALEFVLLESLVRKIKMLKFGTKNARFPYSEAEIWKCYCHI